MGVIVLGAIWERRKPTAAQLDFLRELRAQSDMDADYYLDRRPEDMSRHEVQALIDELRYIKNGGENLCTIQRGAKSDGRDLGADSEGPGDIL